jgi:glucose/arabinose dehydrogenase
MRKNIRIALIIIFIGLSVWAGIFYWQNLRGIAPTIKPASENIATDVNTLQNPLVLPAGFSISIFADNLVDPRVMIFDQNENILVSVPSEGKVVLVPNKADSRLNKAITLISGLNQPHGLVFYCKPNCKLYVAETNAVSVYDYDPQNFKAANRKKLFDLPGGGNHFTRTLLITNVNGEDKLLVSIGSDCNVCNESDQQRAKILSANLDGSDLKTFSSGLRNSVFMAINPISKQIWATEMGRDLLGDNIPPDEINIIQENKNYGWPICYGKNIHDTSFDKNTYIRNPCMEPFETQSYIDIPAHSAPLGLAFIPNDLGWPQEYQNSLFIAYHGSWNRSIPTGYKIVRYKLDDKGSVISQTAENFITGWLTSATNAIGRPADILFEKNTGMFVSDDKAGVIYLISYKP